MLLRRFTAHVKAQNWFAVALDVCVVVVGIFVGLQVTDWADERQLRAQEREYIERLHSSVSLNIVELENALKLHQYLEASQKDVLKILTLDELSAEHRKELNLKMLSIAFWRAIDLDTGFIDSLIASGKIEIIQNYELQAAIVGSSTSAKTLNSQLNHFRSWYAGLQPEFLRMVQVQFDFENMLEVNASSADGTRSMMTLVELNNLDSLLGSPELISILSAMLATRVNFRTMLAQHLDQARTVEQLLVAELNKP